MLSDSRAAGHVLSCEEHGMGQAHPSSERVAASVGGVVTGIHDLDRSLSGWPGTGEPPSMDVRSGKGRVSITVIRSKLHKLSTLTLFQFGMVCLATAIAIIGGTMIEEPPGNVTVVLLGIGTIALVVGATLVGSTWSSRSAILGAVFGAITMIVMPLVRFPEATTVDPEILLIQLLGGLIAVAALSAGEARPGFVRMLAFLGIGLLVFFSFDIAGAPPINIDVYLIHEQAADALADGLNPYTTGNVGVVESHIFDDPDLIQEYTYPPLTLIAFAGSSLVLGDSRYAGAIAVVVSFVLVMLFLSRRKPESGPGLSVDAATIGLMCAVPVTLLLVFVAWTETLALPFLILAAGLWGKKPFASAVMLGLAFATKQYFIVAVPLLFFLPDPYRWRRVLVVGTTAFLTFVPFFIWDAEGLYNGVVKHHLTREPRPDSATLGGLGIHLPTTIGVGVAVLVGILIARRVRSSAQLLLAISSVIAVFTILSVRGFRNQWWLVVMLACVAVGFGATEDETVDASPQDATGVSASASLGSPSEQRPT